MGEWNRTDRQVGKPRQAAMLWQRQGIRPLTLSQSKNKRLVNNVAKINIVYPRTD